MTTNPLANRKPGKGAAATREQLEEHAAELNRKRFVQGNGWFYFVGTTEDGLAELRRNDHSNLTHHTTAGGKG
jgi:sugar phosphate isomerase/epimerase